MMELDNSWAEKGRRGWGGCSVRGGFGTREHDFKPRLFSMWISAWGGRWWEQFKLQKLLTQSALFVIELGKEEATTAILRPTKMLPKTWHISQSWSKRGIDTQKSVNFGF